MTSPDAPWEHPNGQHVVISWTTKATEAQLATIEKGEWAQPKEDEYPQKLASGQVLCWANRRAKGNYDILHKQVWQARLSSWIVAAVSLQADPSRGFEDFVWREQIRLQHCCCLPKRGLSVPLWRSVRKATPIREAHGSTHDARGSHSIPSDGNATRR